VAHEIWTSENNPIRVNWVDVPGAPDGGLGMTFLPGKRADGIFGRHDRSLDADVLALRDVHRVDTFVLLVEDDELRRFWVPDLPAAMERTGIELMRLPIVDGGVPADISAVQRLIRTLMHRLESGRRVVIACRGGLGRTGTIAACLLRAAGMDAEAAITAVRAARRKVIETSTQEDFVRSFVPS
jgi:protein-tyrosine phosphatase